MPTPVAGHAQARLPSTDPAPKIPEQRCGTVAPTCHTSRACRARGVKFAGYDVGSVIMGNGQCSMLVRERERERERASLFSLSLSHTDSDREGGRSAGDPCASRTPRVCYTIYDLRRCEDASSSWPGEGKCHGVTESVRKIADGVSVEWEIPRTTDHGCVNKSCPPLFPAGGRGAYAAESARRIARCR